MWSSGILSCGSVGLEWGDVRCGESVFEIQCGGRVLGCGRVGI